MIAYLTELCPDCGNLRSVCSDPDGLWYPQRRMCYATADREVLKRRVEQKHGHPGEKDTQRHPTDGMALWVAAEDLSPDDDFA
jgi:hypothetical protein